MIFKKDDTVRFVSSVAGVPDLYPITSMSEYKPEWVGKAREITNKIINKTKNIIT